MVSLAAETWGRGNVVVARSLRLRRKGLTPRAADRSILIRGSAVHSFGMREPISIIGIDETGKIVARRILQPHRLARLRGAVWILELPVQERLPALGATVAILANS